MSRPMVLMQEGLLELIYDKYVQGVPVLALIRQHNLDGKITAPTLTKLLSYMSAMEKSTSEVAKIIYKSLFPAWLKVHKDTVIATSPINYHYIGKMPLGAWIESTDK